MIESPNIVRIAALIGDRARAEVLTALLGGKAFTATELAGIASVTKQTVSTHLAKLTEARLIVVEAHGRHRYFRLADGDIAQLLESLLGVALHTGAVRLRSGPREPAMRKARVCYDHLAGELSVQIYESLLKRGALAASADGLALTTSGKRFFDIAGVETDSLRLQRRSFCRACLDWSERRYHLAGALGAAVLTQIIAQRWAKRVPESRVILFEHDGEEKLRELFQLP